MKKIVENSYVPPNCLEYVGWKITSKCNLDCRFCYAEEENPTELSLDAIKVGLNNLKNTGVKAINITGGEPLLRDDVAEICSYIKSIGLAVMLSSNGTLLKDLSILNGRIDWLSLSLDTVLMQENVYAHKGQRKVIEVIKKFSLETNSFGLKINTLVTKENKDDLHYIGSFLTDQGVDLKWKLIKIAPRGRARTEQDNIDISLEEFLDLAKLMKMRYENLQVSYWPSSFNETKAYYLIINSEGRLMLPIEDKYICLGSVFSKDLDQILLNLKSNYSKIKIANSVYFANSYGSF